MMNEILLTLVPAAGGLGAVLAALMYIFRNGGRIAVDINSAPDADTPATKYERVRGASKTPRQRQR